MFLRSLEKITKCMFRGGQFAMIWIVLFSIAVPLNSAETRCKWSGIEKIVARTPMIYSLSVAGG